VIPVGPLHPADAVYALVFGLAVGATAFRSIERWPLLVTAASIAVMSGRHPGDITEGFARRPLPWLVAALAVASLAGAWWATAHRSVQVRTAALEVAASCVAVWAVVPDTESPLIAGLVLAGAMVFMPRGDGRSYLGQIWALPIGSAVIGSVGMPDRLPVAALAAIVAVFAVNVVQSALVRLRVATTRAGVPTTVVRGATSSMTTAPAPTTAP